MRIGFLASHRGSNMQAVVDACTSGQIAATPVVLVTNNPDAGALQRARAARIPSHVINRHTHPEEAERDRAVAATLRDHGAELVILAGYMKRVGPHVLDAYGARIVNIHPALLPRHGGQGMYGRRVHEAVLAAGDRETGITIHLVDAQYDHGKTLAQTRVPVLEGDTADSLAARVLEREHTFLVETIRAIADGSLDLGESGDSNTPCDRGPSNDPPISLPT